MVPVWFNAPPADIESFVPMMYWHGFFSQAKDFCGIMSEMASHGYICFVIDCHSGMNVYTEKKNGVPLEYSPKWDLKTQGMDYNGIKASIDQRAGEGSLFIDELLEPGFLQAKLGFPDNTSLDTERLIMNGHSLGASTSFVESIQDERVKCCLAMDPYHGISQYEKTEEWNLKAKPWQVIMS